MKKTVQTLLSLALFGACSLAGQAQPAFKVLILDMAKLYDGHWETEAQNAKLSQEQQAASEELQKLNAQGNALYAQYKELDEQSKSPTLTADARGKAQAEAQKKLEEVQRKQNDVTTFQNNVQRQLSQRVKAFRDIMLDQISTIAVKIAKGKGATLLIDKSGPTAIGVSNIIYSDPAYDITDEVMKEINKDRPAATAVVPTAVPAGGPPMPAPAASPANKPPMITVPGAKK